MPKIPHCEECGHTPPKRDVPFDDEHRGEMFLHCMLCLSERPPNVSPKDYARLQVAWTQHGLQVWCLRHNANVLHVNFEGHQHPGITTRKA